MPKLGVDRSLRIAADVHDVRARLLEFARLEGFIVSRATAATVELARGRLLDELFSSDVRKVPITLRADLAEGEGPSTRVTVRLVARTRFGLFTAGDRDALEKWLDALTETLGRTAAPAAPGAVGPGVPGLRSWVDDRTGIQAAAVIVALLALVIYALTLLPGVSFGDWSEMQAVPYQLGIAHPTGYPLAVLLGKLWSFLPIGSVAYRANLLSAVEVSLALGVAVLLMGRLGVRPLVAGALAIVLAAVPTVWEAGTTARVDGLHFLFVTLILHRALVWGQDRRPRDFVLVALLIGLSFANHLLTLMVAPFVVLYVLWVGRHELLRRPLLVPAAALAGLAGLALYLYIPIRAAIGPSWAYGQLLKPEEFWYLVSGAMFRGDMKFLTVGGLDNFVVRWPDLWALIRSRWHPVLLLVALAGLGATFRRDRGFAVLTVVLLVANVYFYVNYVGHLEHYLLLTWLVIATWIAVAAEDALALASRALADTAIRRRSTGPLRPPPIGTVAAVLLAMFAAWVVGSNWAANDRSGDHRGEAFVEQVFAMLPQNAVLLTYWDALEPLWYAHCVEGLRPDLTVLSNPAPATQGCQDFHGDVATLVARRPTYALLPFDRDYDALRRRFDLVPVEQMLAPYGNPYPQFRRDLMRVTPRT